MQHKTLEEFFADLGQFSTCMLVTRDGAHLRARPMRPYVDRSSHTIRFLTSTRTHKVDEIKRAPEANLVFTNDDGEWISVSGPVHFSQSKEDIDALWTPEAEPYFENGKEEAIVMLLEPDIAEYWDNTGFDLSAGWEKVAGALTGRQPKEMGEHGKVAM